MCRRAAVVMCRMANCQIHLNVVANEVQYLDLLLLMVYSLEVGLVVHVSLQHYLWKHYTVLCSMCSCACAYAFPEIYAYGYHEYAS